MNLEISEAEKNMEAKTRELLRRGGPNGADVYVRIPQRRKSDLDQKRKSWGYAIWSELEQEHESRLFFKRYF